jgi:hypothetical protein
VSAVEVHVLNGPPGNPKFFIPDRTEEVAERDRPQARRDGINAGGKDRTAVEAADKERLAGCRVLREGGEEGRTVRAAEDVAPPDEYEEGRVQEQVCRVECKTLCGEVRDEGGGHTEVLAVSGIRGF